MSEAIEALAEAWASLDGKLDEFLAGRRGEDTEGDYHGYLSDAARLADLGGTVLPGTPADFAKLIAEETQKWAKVVKFSGAKPE